jgi:hypothetical protein
MSTDFEYKYHKYKSKYENSKQDGGTLGRVGELNTINMTSVDEILMKCFEHQLMIKMLHFQSKKYGAHKALDAYLLLFDANFDRFMEALQGAVDNRTELVQFNLQIDVATDVTIQDRLTEFKISVLDAFVNDNFNNNPGLLAIRDEMVADLDQLKYLLTFE